MAKGLAAIRCLPCVSFLLACWSGMVRSAFAVPPDAPQVTRVVKLTHLAIILPELQFERERWSGGPHKTDLWSPTVQQVADAEKAIVRETHRGEEPGKAEPKVDYVIQYWGLSVDSRKWIVCQVWRVDALRGKFDGLNDFLTKVLTESLPAIEEPSDAEPPHYFEYYYNTATGALEDYPFDGDQAKCPDCGEGGSGAIGGVAARPRRPEARRSADRPGVSHPLRGIREARSEKRR